MTVESWLWEGTQLLVSNRVVCTDRFEPRARVLTYSLVVVVADSVWAVLRPEDPHTSSVSSYLLGTLNLLDSGVQSLSM